MLFRSLVERGVRFVQLYHRGWDHHGTNPNDDIVHRREGQYRLRLMDNHKGADCAYPAMEVLPDGTYVVTTYGHWIEGEAPFNESDLFFWGRRVPLATVSPLSAATVQGTIYIDPQASVVASAADVGPPVTTPAEAG